MSSETFVSRRDLRTAPAIDESDARAVDWMSASRVTLAVDGDLAVSVLPTTTFSVIFVI